MGSKPMKRFLLTALIAIGTVWIVLLMIDAAISRDLGQWENSDPVTKQWYQSLMRPDAPASSCCGEADAYWCDDIHVKDGATSCTITDDREDKPLRRPHVEIGTVITVPNEKLKWDKGNPTGHAVIFLANRYGAAGGWGGGNGDPTYVLCFVQGSGI